MATILVAGLTACGGLSTRSVVVRVGGEPITKRTVDAWTGVLEHDGAAGGFRGVPRGSTPRQRALSLLISSHWLVAEAARQGVPVSDEALDGALAERTGAGEAQARGQLRKTRQTSAELKRELKAELAIEVIREALASRAGQISHRMVAAFFYAHRRQFDIPEARLTNLIENLPSASAAAALVKRIGTGRRFSETGGRPELVLRKPGGEQIREKQELVDAIFAARPGVVSRPIKFIGGGWVVFVVRKIIPPKPRSLASAYQAVLLKLDIQRQHEIASRFSTEFTVRWKARTSCRPGYIVPGCRQSSAKVGPYEDPFSLKAHPLLSESQVNALADGEAAVATP